MRKRIFWVMPLAAAIVLCLFTAPGVHAARGVSADTIKMGLIMVKTGPWPPWATPGNALVDEALKRASEDPRFAEIKEGRWHTGDFDTIWFERGKIPSLTLSAQDENGLIPHLHRPEDTLRNVDPRLPALAVDFAEATVRSLAARLAV